MNFTETEISLIRKAFIWSSSSPNKDDVLERLEPKLKSLEKKGEMVTSNDLCSFGYWTQKALKKLNQEKSSRFQKPYEDLKQKIDRAFSLKQESEWQLLN